MPDHSNEADMMKWYILRMLCNAQSLFCGTVMEKGIPSFVPRGYLIAELAACTLNTNWPNLLLRLKYRNKPFSIAEN